MPPVFSSPKVTILRCSADRATKAVFSQHGGRLRCERHDTAAFPQETIGGNGWLENVCSAIQALRNDATENIPAVLVLAPHATLLKHVRTPRVAARKRAQIVAFEAGQNIPCPLDQVVWDSLLSGEGETTQDVLLVAAKLDVVAALCAAAQAAGFAVQRIIPDALAVLALGRVAFPKCREPELLVVLDAVTTTVMQMAGRDFAIRSIPCSRIDGAPPEKLAERLAAEVTRTILYFQRQCAMSGPVRLWVAGDAVQQAGVVPLLAERLGLSAQVLELGERIDVIRRTGETSSLREVGQLAGAAAMALLSDQARVNLLPPRLRTLQRRQRRQPWLLVAALLVLAAPVGPWISLRGQAQRAETELRAVEALLGPLRAREAINRTHLVRLDELERELTAWEAVELRQTAWLQFFADLQERLADADDVWIEKLQLLQATKDSPLRLAVAGRMLERSNPQSQSRQGTPQRVKALLNSLAQSPFVAAVENERFDARQAGLLAFEFVLVTKEDRPL